MKQSIVYIAIALFVSCSGNDANTLVPALGESIFADSVHFRHYERHIFPCLIKSSTYAYTDSMSQVLDSMPVEKLSQINGSDRGFFDDLSYTKKSDTIIVNLIYNPGPGRFPFGDIKVESDTIFLCLAGDVYKKLPPVSDSYKNPYRYYNSVFQILVKDSVKYKIFFRRDGF